MRQEPSYFNFLTPQTNQTFYTPLHRSIMPWETQIWDRKNESTEYQMSFSVNNLKSCQCIFSNPRTIDYQTTSKTLLSNWSESSHLVGFEPTYSKSQRQAKHTETSKQLRPPLFLSTETQNLLFLRFSFMIQPSQYSTHVDIRNAKSLYLPLIISHTQSLQTFENSSMIALIIQFQS